MNYKAVQTMLDQAAPGVGGQVVVLAPGVGRGVNACVMALAKALVLPHVHDAALHQLFDPAIVNYDQEHNVENLLAMMQKEVGAVGVHTGAFVYHANAATPDSQGPPSG